MEKILEIIEELEEELSQLEDMINSIEHDIELNDLDAIKKICKLKNLIPEA